MFNKFHKALFQKIAGYFLSLYSQQLSGYKNLTFELFFRYDKQKESGLLSMAEEPWCGYNRKERTQMSIWGVNNILAGAYQTTNIQNNIDQSKITFKDKLQQKQAAIKNTGAKQESAVQKYIAKHPKDETHVTSQVRAGKKVLAQNNAENISRDDMTMEEYKAFFTSLMNSIPFDASHRGDQEIWSISEDGWEQMKNDPEYEAWVLGYTAENRSVYIPFAALPGYSPNFCTEKFGSSIEQHIGQSVPMNNERQNRANDVDEESWWIKRHKLLKEELKTQAALANKRRTDNIRNQLLNESAVNTSNDTAQAAYKTTPQFVNTALMAYETASILQ